MKHRFPKRNTRAEIRLKIIGSFPWEIPKNQNRVWKPYLLCVCCVLTAVPNFWRPFWAIFCLTVDGTSCHVLVGLLWRAVASTVTQKIAPNGLLRPGKAAKTQQTHSRQWSSNSISLLRHFARKTADLYFGSNFSSIQTTLILCFG